MAGVSGPDVPQGVGCALIIRAVILMVSAMRRPWPHPGKRARALMQVRLEVISNAELLVDASELACELQHPASDCIHVALAHLRGVPLVKADMRPVERCRNA